MLAKKSRHHLKHFVDLMIVVPALLLLSPVLALIALLVRLKIGSPIFFFQERPGLSGRPFHLLKFRTMTNARDDQGNLLPDAERLTAFGKFLRSTSLDELPELLNVLKGEMSLVGPRPLLMRYMPYFSERERKRFETLPGITGLAQVNGRNNLPWAERFSCDVWYVENWSLLLDLKILWLTLLKVFQRENVRIVPQLTMPDLDDERRPYVSLTSGSALLGSELFTRSFIGRLVDY